MLIQISYMDVNGTLPSPNEGEANRTACVKFKESCYKTLHIQVKNCGLFFVYNLIPGPDGSGYCFDGINLEEREANALPLRHGGCNARDFTTKADTRFVEFFGIENSTHPETPGQNIDKLPNASLAIQHGTIMSNSFVTAINVSDIADNITVAIFKDAALSRHSIPLEQTTLVYKWENLRPDTNYTIQIYTHVNGRKLVLATVWTLTKPYIKPTAKIEVQETNLSSESIGLLITYDHGSQNLTAEGTLNSQNGRVVESFQVKTNASSHRFHNLTNGARYSVDVSVTRQGESVVLDQVWVFTRPVVQAYLRSMPTREQVFRYTTFRCKFEPSPDHVFSVRWTIKDAERNLTLYKTGSIGNGFLDLELTEKDTLKKHIHLPFNVTCSVAEDLGTIPETEFSVPSGSLFAGIKVLTPHINMQRDETKSITFLLTVPFGCYAVQDRAISCNLIITVSIPVRKNCTGISTSTCSNQIQGGVNTKQYLHIQSTEDGQYGVLQETTHDVFLRTAPLDNSIWSNYILPVVKVTVKPETDTYWRGKRCEALNDPHMYTFDAMPYEHHESLSDEYILYDHGSFPAKVHHKLERCNSNAMCNCGVAVQAGRDIYLISTCNNMIEIGYKQCDDGVLLVRQETDTTYTIYLPYGTYVNARIDKSPYLNSVGGMIVSVVVYPSVHDKQGRSHGLCGTLDNNRMNDFHGRSGELHLNRTEFINAWRVSKDESLFKQDVKSTTPWKQPACTCSVTNGEITARKECRLGADNNCSRGKTVGEQFCKMSEKPNIESRGNQSVPTLDLNENGNQFVTTQKRPEVTNIPTMSPHASASKSTITPTVRWDRVKAKAFCTSYMDTSRTFRLCSRVPYTDTERAIETCTQDIVLTQTTEWHAISKQSMQDSCISEIHRNKTVREDLERPRKSTTLQHRHSTKAAPIGQPSGKTITPTPDSGIKDSDLDILQIVDVIEEIACPNDCFGHGACQNVLGTGKCKCSAGYGSYDCSIDLKKPPSTASLLHGTTCDEKDAECTHVFIYGGFFASETVRCHITKFETHAITTGRQNMDAYLLPGQAQSLIEVICPLRPTRLKRSVPDNQDVKLVSCYQVSVSNDGIHHRKPLEMCVYNSECQSLLKRSDGILTAVIKEGFCFIGGKCIPSGMQKPSTNTYCLPKIALYSWAEKPTPTTEPKTEETSNIGITHVDTKSSWKTPVFVAAICVCVLCLIVGLVVCIRKKKSRKNESKMKEKEEVIVSYKNDPDFDEETYAHINSIDVSNGLPYVKTPTPDENRLGDYTKLDMASKENVKYAKLNAVDNRRREAGPTLPDRYQTAREYGRTQNEVGSTVTDPYQRLNRAYQSEKEYDRLRKPEKDYLAPTLQLGVGEISQRRDDRYIDLKRDDFFPEGYERPDPQYKNH